MPFRQCNNGCGPVTLEKIDETAPFFGGEEGERLRHYRFASQHWSQHYDPTRKRRALSCDFVPALETHHLTANRAWRAVGIFADIVERTLFNVVATSPAPDGTAFFYANPLHQRVPGVVPFPDQVSNRAASSLREPWFAVSCCPTNVARTFASLAAYLATVDRDGLQIHQFADCRISTELETGRPIGIEMTTGYPFHGKVSIRITETDEAPWSLSIRVPAWADGAVLTDQGSRRTVSPGTTTLTRTFAVGERVELELPMGPRWTVPDPRIDAVRGCVAVEQGPLVLCVESVDLPAGRDVGAVRIDQSQSLEAAGEAVIATGQLVDDIDLTWPYPKSIGRPRGGEIQLRLTPYHQWGNRGPSSMRIWIPTV